MKICVLGAGALGSTIGGTLAHAGNEVTLISRAEDHVNAINKNGLTLIEQGKQTTVTAKAALSTQGLTPVDLVILLVKSFDTRAAVVEAKELFGPNTLVMSLQNGLGHEEVLSELVVKDNVIAGKTYVGGVQVDAGIIESGVKDKLTVIGELSGNLSARTQQVADTFNAAGLLTQVTDNIMGTIWDKLLINVATGAISSLTHLTYGELYKIPEVEACALHAVEEAMSVAQANGVKLSISSAKEAWEMARAGLGPNFKTSMLQSLERKTPTEIDYINGAVVQWGQRSNIPTPYNETLVAAIKGLQHYTLSTPISSGGAV